MSNSSNNLELNNHINFNTLNKFMNLKLKKFFCYISLALLASGCSFFNTEKEPEPKKELPTWYVNAGTVAKDPRYLYGTGAHRTKITAVNLALREIASGLSVSIKSSSVSQRFKSGSTSNNSFNENVESEVKKIDFKKYDLDKQILVDGKHYVLVKVLKSGLLESTRQGFEVIDRSVKNTFKQAEPLDKLNKFFMVKRASNQIDEGYSKLLFLSGMQDLDPFAELEPNKMNEDIARYEGYKNSLDSMLRNISFKITAESSFLGIARAVSQALVEEQIKNAINSGDNVDGVINIGGQVEHGKVQGYFSAQFNLTITVTDNAGKNLQSISRSITGYSPSSASSAEEGAGKKFKKDEIDKKGGILQVLSL